MSLPTVFRDLPASAYPFTIEMLDKDTREVYETIYVEGPGAVKINPKPAHVRVAGTRITLGTGHVEEHFPDD